MTPVVKRSALKMWLMAIAGIPLLVISLDVLTNRKITNQLRELIFRPEDTQIYEPRDVIYAWAIALFAGFIVLWGLKELFMPTRVVEGRFDGLALKINGPIRPPSVISWNNIDDIKGVVIEDDGTKVSFMLVSVLDRDDLPDNPWGARWIGSHDLGVLAEDWSRDPQLVADQIVEYAVQVAREEKKQRHERIEASLEEE